MIQLMYVWKKKNGLTTQTYFARKLELINRLEARLTDIYINSKSKRQTTFCVVTENVFSWNHLDEQENEWAGLYLGQCRSRYSQTFSSVHIKSWVNSLKWTPPYNERF
jgi:hypothetical protein